MVWLRRSASEHAGTEAQSRDAAGGVLGRVIGGDKKGTLIGAIAGAAAGGAVSALVKDVDIVLPAGAHLILTLRQPLTVMAK